MTGRAFVCLGPRPAASWRLICVPYAGAGVAAYRAFTRDLPPQVEMWAVRLPAREARLAEPPLTDIRAVVDALVRELAQDELIAARFALFGHSMGALVCFELARTLRRRGMPVPGHVFVSGRRAPSLPDDLPAIHRLGPADFVTAVQQLGGIPRELLAEKDLIDLMLPALRADFAVCETYQHVSEDPLACPISAFGGRADPITTSVQLDGWREETAGPFSMRLYEGDHFFIHGHRRQILDAVRHDLVLSPTRREHDA